jgi:hypothetical protein
VHEPEVWLRVSLPVSRAIKAVSVLLLIVSAIVMIRAWPVIGPTTMQQRLFAGVAAVVVAVFVVASLRRQYRLRVIAWSFPVICAASVVINLNLVDFNWKVLPLTRRADDTLYGAAKENAHPLISKDLAFYYWLGTKLEGRELVYTPETRKYFDLLLIRSVTRLTPVAVDALPALPPGRVEGLLARPVETMYDGTPVRVVQDPSAKRYVLILHEGVLVFAPQDPG